ncbi:hypothetical protein SO802_016546 [Lithocarpus litseifolius]|uniref:RING-type E3 ubiquitin transferase n=1 Tax=Lithocarpus litseifolius TaxID=425828 RepID=A0AAW2D090_9ROSI
MSRMFTCPPQPPQPSDAATPTPMQIDGGEGHDRQITGEEASEEQGYGEEQKKKKKKKKKELGESNLDGLCCSICMEPWASHGDHQASCLPCGHVYGMSCIIKWIQQCHGYPAKCPQCNAKCISKDVRKLFASPVVVHDEGLQKKIESLQTEIRSLKNERAGLLDVQDKLLDVQDNLLNELHQVKKKQAELENATLGGMGRKPLGFFSAKESWGENNRHHIDSNVSKQEILPCSFVLQQELAVEGATLFDVDASYQILILARRISGMGGTHMLNKINLICPHENEDIQLPKTIRAIKDLRVSPCGRLTLLASLGKKLSILSHGSNELVINYDLPDPAWSCSWDSNNPSYIYAGLQNGMLLTFDMRRTRNPLQCMVGLTSRPIHTIYSLVNNPAFGQGARKLLTASSIGPCVWNTGCARERPFLVPGLENQGICMSLAYSPSSDDIVASYRPKILASNGATSFQSSQSSTALNTVGSQVLVKRVAGNFYNKLGSTSTNVSYVQMTKSTIINIENCYPIFAYGDEVTHGLRLRALPNLSDSQNLKPHQLPILDVKYAHSQGSGLLGCISKDKLQLFSPKYM